MKYQNKVPVQLIIWHCFARKTKACHFDSWNVFIETKQNTNLIGTTREKLVFFDIVGDIFMGSNTEAGLADADFSVHIKASGKYVSERF